MDYITKNKVQISYMDFRGLCVRWAYISGIVVFYKALVSSLWASIGLKSLYEYFSGNKNFQLAILVFYIVFVLLSLMWLVKKIVKTKKY